jgi:hypothetical protein
MHRWKWIFWLGLPLPLAGGRLPQLKESPWLGWFAAYECRKFRFGVQDTGVAVLQPLKKRNDEEVITRKYWIEIEPVIEQVLPDRVVVKRIDEDGWEALSASDADTDTMRYRGTVTGGAVFEIDFRMKGDTISAGGRLVERGGLTEHPVRFLIRVKIPNVYYYIDDEEKVEDLADGDRIRIKRLDGERLSLNGWDPVFAEKEINGEGVEKVRLDLEGYKGERVEVETGAAGFLKLQNGEKQPLYKGFFIDWQPKEEAAEGDEARFELEFG